MFSIYSQTFSVPDLTEERIKKEAKRHVIAPKTNKQNDNKPKINRNMDVKIKILKTRRQTSPSC